MKKVIISVSLCLCVGFMAMAQNVEEEFSAAYANKRGVYLLPQAGDFAVGVEATPFLRYVGNLFTSADNSAPIFRGVDQTIYGKYFLQDNRALRARLTLGLSNDKEKGEVPDDEVRANDPDSEATLFDARNFSSAIVDLGIGYEFRRGHGRVQGFWGGEVGFGFESSKLKYDYANYIDDYGIDYNLYPGASTSNFSSDGSYGWSNARTTEIKSGNTFYAGLGAFLGVEYFFAPQMSIGGELGLGFRFGTTSQGKTTMERWDVDETIIETIKDPYIENAQNIAFATRTSGRIFLMFHF